MSIEKRENANKTNLILWYKFWTLDHKIQHFDNANRNDKRQQMQQISAPHKGMTCRIHCFNQQLPIKINIKPLNLLLFHSSISLPQ